MSVVPTLSPWWLFPVDFFFLPPFISLSKFFVQRSSSHFLPLLHSCTQTCPEKVNIDQKLSLKGTCVVCFGELKFRWKLFQHTKPNTDPTNTAEMEEVQNLEKLSTMPVSSLNLAIKANSLHRDTRYTALFRASRPSGQYGEYFHTFVTNSPPENGKNITCYF